MNVLEVTDLVKHFTVRTVSGIRSTKHTVQAVSNVSFGLGAGQTLGLVGESGSGKTTVGRCVLRLLEPTSGSVMFKGAELTTMRREELRQLRNEMQIVFQDPYASLDPRITVGGAIAEPLQIQKVPGDHGKRVAELLDLVGLAPDHSKRFPHEFSGGQRQRIGIARALALNPSLIVLDEPVSALDVSIQAGVVNLLEDLQDQLQLAYLFIAHDLSVVRHISDTVAVMYLGKLVEIAPSEDIYNRPTHPYTQALLSAIPEPDPGIGAGAEADPAARRGTEPDRSTVRLPVPHPLPEGAGAVLDRRACPGRPWVRPPRGVPFPLARRRADLRRRLGDDRRARVGWFTVRDVIIYLTLVINVVSMFGMTAGVLLHSGRGGGLSDMFGGAGGAALGSTAAERNLNRITFVLALIWVITVISLGILLSA